VSSGLAIFHDKKGLGKIPGIFIGKMAFLEFLLKKLQKQQNQIKIKSNRILQLVRQNLSVSYSEYCNDGYTKYGFIRSSKI